MYEEWKEDFNLWSRPYFIERSKDFWRIFIMTILVGFSIVLVLQLQIIQYDARYGEDGLGRARELGLRWRMRRYICFLRREGIG